MEELRLNHYIAKCGIASRRSADKLIDEGRVRVNGAPASQGQKVSSADLVEVDGKAISPENKTIVIAVNKPVGVVCTEAHFAGEQTLSSIVKLDERVFSIGRLDKNSEGLILMTNDGALAQAVSKGANAHEKEYEVRLNKPVTADFIEKMRAGVDIEIDGKTYTTRECEVKKTGVDAFTIVLTQGFNRQIRRMCEALGARVRKLRRVRVMNVRLGDLPVGSYRELTTEELRHLYKACGLSLK